MVAPSTLGFATAWGTAPQREADVIESALQLIRDLRQSNSAGSARPTRPLGRPDALRLALTTSASSPRPELARLQTIVKRGHWHDLMSVPEPGMVLQPTSGDLRADGGEALSQRARVPGPDQLPFFTLFIIRPEGELRRSPARARHRARRERRSGAYSAASDRLSGQRETLVSRPQDPAPRTRTAARLRRIRSKGSIPANEDAVRTC
jgi:hypothetical protein